MTLRVLIADDEVPARERLRALLAQLPDTELIAEAASGAEAVAQTVAARPDVVLLDIRMPGMSGLEAARHLASLDRPPAIVFTTAYDQYAVEAFESQAVGYLLKPVRAEKLGAALQRAARATGRQLAAVALRPGLGGARTHLTVRHRESIRLIPLDEVYYFSADQKYTTVRHAGGTDLLEDSLKALEEEFGARFLRVHRNALVDATRIVALAREADGQWAVALAGLSERIGVSRRLVAELRGRLGL